MSFDRFDICEAYLVLEWDYNKGGWLQERPSNRRRMEAISVQLHRIQFKPSMGLCFDSLSDNGKEIYLSRVVEWKLPVDGEMRAVLLRYFTKGYLLKHRPELVFEHECSMENAAKFKDWFANRGGIAIWRSINLSNPGASWTSPALTDGLPTTKPNWQCENTPTIITDPSKVGVYVPELFKSIKVKLLNNTPMLMSGAMFLKLSDASQRKVDKAMDECREKHGDAFFERGGLEDPRINVYFTKSIVPLTEVA